MTRRKSRSEIEMEVQLEQLDPETPRYQVLRAARDFKASWVALGELLTTVRESREFEKWGYTDFEKYCRRELHIKKDTANKLTRSYAFLRDHEPTVLEQPEAMPRELPPLDVVDLLTRARERAKVSDEQFEAIRKDVFSEETAPPTRAAVVKRFREVDPEAFKPAAKPKPTPGSGGPAEVKKALLLAERLGAVLELLPVTPTSQDSVRSVVTELKHLFDTAANDTPEQKSA
ncbi:MAG: hypothetical protein AAF654_09470 [Myxococcota bacterium]